MKIYIVVVRLEMCEQEGKPERKVIEMNSFDARVDSVMYCTCTL